MKIKFSILLLFLLFFSAVDAQNGCSVLCDTCGGTNNNVCASCWNSF